MRLIFCSMFAALAAWAVPVGVNASLADAIQRGDNAAVKALLAQRVDVNARAADSSTPLH